MPHSHTPGPWVGTENNGVSAEDGTPVFETGCGCCTSSTLSAPDARLIAAAPELLEALRECAERLQPHIKHTEDLVAHMRACKAIKQATGEQ